MTAEPLYILTVLAALVAASELLARHTALRHLGGALLVIVLTAIAANCGVIPTFSDEIPIYGIVFDYVAPLGIFWLLLQVNLRSILRAGMPMLVLFLIGSAATFAGVFLGMWIVGGEQAFGELHHALGGMFVGTYTGGSVNFNAVAIEYGVREQGALYPGAAAVDSAMTTVWMAATVTLPRVLAPWWPLKAPAAEAPTSAADEPHGEPVDLVDLAVLLALGAAAVLVSDVIASWLAESAGVGIPATLVMTTIALALAQVPAVQRMRGMRVLGLLAVYVFLAVIGALCDVSAVREIGDLAVSLTVFVTVIVIVHGGITFGAARLLRFDAATAAVASQANIGGSTSAMALARSLGRNDLVLPAILVGSLGLALGNYLGFLAAAWLE